MELQLQKATAVTYATQAILNVTILKPKPKSRFKDIPMVRLLFRSDIEQLMPLDTQHGSDWR